MFSVEDVDHSKYTNRQLLLVPVSIFLLILVVIGLTYATTGAPAHLGLDFTGGVEVQINSDNSLDQIENDFSNIEGVPSPENVRATTLGNSYIVTLPSLSDDELRTVENFVSSSEYEKESINQIQPTYGTSLLNQGVGAVIFAFVIMSIIVILLFRTFVPAMSVVLSAFSDMIIPLGVMNILSIKLTLATIPALLLLIGYSIDSDILLTRNVLKGRRGNFYENVKTAMETGITMTTTSMAAMLAMVIVSHLADITILRDIGIILFVGLGMDIINTYMMNVAILRWHVLGRKEGS